MLYKYKLCRKNGIWQTKIYNSLIGGAALEGKVVAVDGEKVKLHLKIDDNQSEEEAAWFPYAPPTGNAMYSMPIVGTDARLYFPSESGENPSVTGCARTNGSSCAKTSDTTKRYFGTEHGSELEMTPGALNIKGGSKEPLNVSFDDETGVTIKSPKKLTLDADDEIIMKTPKSVKLKAESQILVAKEDSQSGFSLENEMHFKSNNVIKNGSCRDTYEAFKDEPKAGQKTQPKEDKGGFSWKKLALGVVAGLAIAASVVTFGLFATVAVIAVGAIVANAAIKAAESAQNSVEAQVNKNGDVDYGEVLKAAFDGAVTGAVNMFKTEVFATADWIAQTGLGMASLLNICTNFVPSCRDNVNAKIRELSNTSHEFYKGLVPKGYEDAFDYSQYVLTVATLADSAVSINNIIKNPPKMSFGTGAFVDTMGNIFGSNLNPAVATAMATTAEVTGIAGFMGGSLFNFAQKDGIGTGSASKNSTEVDSVPPEKLLGTEHEPIKNPRESLNDKIPRSKSANKKIRTDQRLTPKEKRLANQHLNDLTARRNGDTVAAERLSKYREHALEDLSKTGGDNYGGWTSLDLSDTNDASNVMRLIYIETIDGIEWKVIQQH